jgi:predicted ArsR family transcriptional regulator
MILQAITMSPKSIRDLAQELGVHRLTLRYHLNFLLREGFIEEVPAQHLGHAGRPPSLYRISRHARIPGFPPRRFEFIAQAALTSLLEALGDRDAKQRLYDKGRQVGIATIDGIAAAKGVKKWTPAAFEEHVLHGAYRDMGVSTQVLSSTAKSIEYRAYGCPFLELAEQMPDLVCNAMDQGFHDGVDEGLGKVSTERRHCMGHGDMFCEYKLDWETRRRPRGPLATDPPPKAAPGALR